MRLQLMNKVNASKSFILVSTQSCFYGTDDIHLNETHQSISQIQVYLHWVFSSLLSIVLKGIRYMNWSTRA